MPGAQEGSRWWRDAVVYQCYVRSFADGDGDGEGDLVGLRRRLPYLRDLGVDALWLTPFYPSPMADGGYDVADYRDVDPRFGVLGDVDTLLADAHALGLRVIVDVVPNHTSSAHRWFREALEAGPGTPERARYLFRPGRGPGGEEPPNDWQSVFEGPAWTRASERDRDDTSGEWYLHLFAPEQPDLDWRNPEVGDELETVLRFWLDRGVDGFRIDVAHGLVKDPLLPDAGAAAVTDRFRGRDAPGPIWDQPEVHEVYRRWRTVLDGYDGERIAVGEVNLADPDALARYIRPDELHQAFNFRFLREGWDASSWREVVDASLHATGLVGAPTTWTLANHDVPRAVTRFGGGERGVRRARAAALFVLALPGCVYVYQGEELGLPEVEDLPDEARQDPIWTRSGGTDRGRDGCRVPLPWSGAAPPYGFCVDEATPWLPQPEGWAGLTAEAQACDPGSVLGLYRRALRTRRTEPSLGDGTLRWLDTGGPEAVLAFARDAEPGVVCVLNMGTAPVEMPVPGDVLLSSGPLDGGCLPPDTAAWIRPHARG